MAERWQLFVQGCRDKTVPILVPKDCRVDELFREVGVKCAQGADPGSLRILFAGKELINEPSKRLSDYAITNMANLVMVLRLPGGMYAATSSLRPLYGFVEVITDPDEPDMISLDGTVERARMPCGHVIGRLSLTEYCRSELKAGRYDFRCPDPGCQSRWEYFFVRHVALLTADEQRQIEVEITQNYLMKSNGVQRCPGCRTWCCREDASRNRVRCVVCERQLGAPSSRSQFCWSCLGWWLTDNPRWCGNVDCTGTDPRIRLLATCATKTIGDVAGCPLLRGCIGCGIVIEHREACRHMTCTACQQQFCFICLREMSGNAHPGDCAVVARQTWLRGM